MAGVGVVHEPQPLLPLFPVVIFFPFLHVSGHAPAALCFRLKKTEKKAAPCIKGATVSPVGGGPRSSQGDLFICWFCKASGKQASPSPRMTARGGLNYFICYRPFIWTQTCSTFWRNDELIQLCLVENFPVFRLSKRRLIKWLNQPLCLERHQICNPPPGLFLHKNYLEKPQWSVFVFFCNADFRRISNIQFNFNKAIWDGIKRSCLKRV